MQTFDQGKQGAVLRPLRSSAFWCYLLFSFSCLGNAPFLCPPGLLERSCWDPFPAAAWLWCISKLFFILGSSAEAHADMCWVCKLAVFLKIETFVRNKSRKTQYGKNDWNRKKSWDMKEWKNCNNLMLCGKNLGWQWGVISHWVTVGRFQGSWNEA